VNDNEEHEADNTAGHYLEKDLFLIVSFHQILEADLITRNLERIKKSTKK